MTSKRVALALALIVLVLLAGCQTGSNGTPTDKSLSPTDGGPSAGNASAIAATTIDRLRGIDAYAMNTTQTITVEANFEQETELEQSVQVNRRADRLYAIATQRTLQGVTSNEVFIYNESVYERSQVYAQRFGTEWVQAEITGNQSEPFQTYDGLRQQRRVLAETMLTHNGTETVDGVETHRLETTNSLDAIEELFAERLSRISPRASFESLERGSYTFWISTDTNRLVRVTGEVAGILSIRGQQQSFDQTFEIRFDYAEFDRIQPPEIALSAPAISTLLNSSNAGS